MLHANGYPPVAQGFVDLSWHCTDFNIKTEEVAEVFGDGMSNTPSDTILWDSMAS